MKGTTFAAAALVAPMVGCLPSFPSSQAGNEGSKDAAATDATNQSADGGGTTSDGAADAGWLPAADAEAGAADAAAASGDAAIPLVTLNCGDTSWVYPSPVDLAPLGDIVWTSNATPTTLRTVVESGQNFGVYSIDTSSTPPQVTSVNIPFTGPEVELVKGVHTSDGFAVVAATQPSDNESELDLYLFPDSSPLPAQAPGPYVLASISGSITSAVVLEVAPSEYYVAFSNQDTAQTITIFAGLAVGGQPISLNGIVSSMVPFQVQAAAISGSNVVLFTAAPDDNVGVGYYVMPVTVSSSGPLTSLPTLDDGGVFPEIVDIVPGSAANTTNVAYEEWATGAPDIMQRIVVKQIANAALDPFAISSLTGDGGVDQTFTDPATGTCLGNSALFGDDFVSVGAGCLSREITDWDNFVWYDVHGVVRASQTGANGILQGQGGISNIFASPGPRSPTSAAWNFVWTGYRQADGASSGDVFFNQLLCQ